MGALLVLGGAVYASWQPIFLDPRLPMSKKDLFSSFLLFSVKKQTAVLCFKEPTLIHKQNVDAFNLCRKRHEYLT